MKLYTKLTISLLFLLTHLPNFAQKNTASDSVSLQLQQMQSVLNTLSKIKLSGYIQAQFQVADSTGIASFEGGNFAAETDKRFMVRRGRLKLQHNGAHSLMVIQLDATERGVGIKDAYISIIEPWSKTISITAGVFDRPFGFEITYSSTVRESPERARMSQILFPGERDLGAMLTYQAPSTSLIHFIRLDAGLFNGTGISSDFDKHKDFIGRFRLNEIIRSKNIKFSAGASYYNGGWRQSSSYINEIGVLASGAEGFIQYYDTANYGRITQREYMGADAQFSFDWIAGKTTLRGEYIFGTQPALNNSSFSPGSSTPPSGAVFIREFDGAYFYFVQNILKSKHQLVIKYDWYDPNINIEGNQIGAPGSNLSAADIKYNSIGFGWNFQIDNNIKFMAFYQMVENEKTMLSGYTKNLKDNVLTLRLQHRF